MEIASKAGNKNYEPRGFSSTIASYPPQPDENTVDNTVDNTGEEDVLNKEDYFNINQFEMLLERLEASKGRQQRQKSVEGRRDTFAKGLAGMMGNF